MCAHLIQVRHLLPLAHPQHRGHAFTEPGVRSSDHDCFGDPRHGEQKFLDFECADVLTAADDDVGLTVGDGQIALGVDHTDIAGVVPAVGVEGPFGECVIGVPETQIRSAGKDFAILGQPDLHTRTGIPIGEQSLVLRRRQLGTGDGRMLGAAVGPEDDDAEICQPAGHRGRHRRPAEADGGDPAQVRLGEVRMVEQAGHEVGRPTPDRHPLAIHEVEDQAGIPDIAEVDR